ncbi:D-alanyl-D-alanine carboxypeptidase [Sphingobacterium sp. lm-10]|uniref:D-alanyl-D-alanine carboxypeptidase n=1 Tax=Sphingobacterium sp. lm-10 TaxID=2944904 RepID=UPI0020213D0A|nr:D-alanyl-D-alanine carboxypeptidase [Sphingobacterium sp. lm-10]MCL7986763.1 D-alanyl-D-alanine carboxypeptidase [Sphingobacterium sp. lm-10]
MIRWFLLLLMLPVLHLTHAQHEESIQKLFQESAVLQQHLHGFSLYDIDEKRYVYGVNENVYFTPASNTKLFTLLQSLQHLGDSIPGLAYVIRGDSLIFWGTGDPTFLHRKLDTGKVYTFLSKTPYKLFYAPAQILEPAYRDGWAAEDYQNDFQPEITSFPIYGNTVQFRNVRGQLRTIPRYFEANVSVKPGIGGFDINRHPHENYFDMTSYRIRTGFVSHKPFIYSSDLFVTLLQDTLHRPVTVLAGYSMPSDVQYVYSMPTKKILREMMLYSDNFLAEQLCYGASFLLFNQFNAARLRAYMSTTYYSLFTNEVDLYDGSGLSFYNKVTPRSMIELLLMLRKAVRTEEELLRLFPAGRSSGTLRNLYSLPKGQPFVWAKTGTINSVYAQSGFLLSASGKRYAFSFMNNNYFGNLNSVKEEIVRIITFIHQNY